MSADLYERAAEYVAKWEGFSPTAYWDVNHWRIGFGSSTEGPHEVNVVKGMTTTRERAMQNLELRIPEFRYVAVRDVGKVVWDQLNMNQQIVLIDLAYNYGHIPVPVNPKEPALTAHHILQRGKDNGGINARRRRDEASLWIKPYKEAENA